MQYQTIQKSDFNLFVKLGVIPLGMNSFKGRSKEKIITMPYKKYSGAWGVVGESGTGKTVLVKRIYSYKLGYYQRKYGFFRPGIIFDMQSEDHHLSMYKNSRPFNLFRSQGEIPIQMKNIECYAPYYIRDESHYFDKVFGFSVDQFGMRDFLSIGMGTGAAKQLDFIIKNNPDSTKSIDDFYEAIEKLPVNKYELKNIDEDYPFKLKTHFVYSSKQSLINSFTHAYHDKVFIDIGDKNQLNDIIELLKKGKIIVINFHQEERYYSLYAGKILKDLYLARRESKRSEDINHGRTFPPPVIIVEEVDKLVPKSASITTQASAYWLLEILKRGRKYDFLTIIATQEASAMSDEIKTHTRQWIIGKMVANDYGYFSSIFSSDIMDAIKRLDKTKFEFCIVYPDNSFDTFYAWNSPLEINRESAIIGSANKHIS